MSANVNSSHSCPITPKEAENLTESLKKIDQRLSKIERMMFAGRVALSVVFGLALAAGWVIDHAESLKQGVISWLRH